MDSQEAADFFWHLQFFHFECNTKVANSCYSQLSLPRAPRPEQGLPPNSLAFNNSWVFYAISLLLCLWTLYSFCNTARWTTYEWAFSVALVSPAWSVLTPSFVLLFSGDSIAWIPAFLISNYFLAWLMVPWSPCISHSGLFSSVQFRLCSTMPTE